MKGSKTWIAVLRDASAFWCLGLLNNFLYVVMNAGANNISDTAIGLVYLAGILPTLIVKLTGPYWFHLVSYKIRIQVSAFLMTACLFVVAWGKSSAVKLFGVSLASFQSGLGEASLLAMASFYHPKYCLSAWASGTGFAGIFGYLWSIYFTQVIDACFQVQLMVGLWIPLAWLGVFHCMLKEPSVDRTRGACEDENAQSDWDSSEGSPDRSEVSGASSSYDRPLTEKLTCIQRFRFTLSLWKYMIPLFLVYVSEYIIQAGAWASMGFPDVHIAANRHKWYQWANFTYQIGVFVSRTLGGLKVLPLSSLWAGPALQVLLLVFFGVCAAESFGDWWLIGPALCVGLLGGFVYVQAFVQISAREKKEYVELALTTASVADTFGIIVADVLAIMAQGCLFGRLSIKDVAPTFQCGYHIWGATGQVQGVPSDPPAICFPGVNG